MPCTMYYICSAPGNDLTVKTKNHKITVKLTGRLYGLIQLLEVIVHT